MKTIWMLSAVVLGCALGAGAQTTTPDFSVIPPADFVREVAEASENDTLVLEGDGDYAGPVSVKKSITIRGEDGYLGHQITITGGITVETGATLRLVGVGLNFASPADDPGTAGPAIMVMPGGTVIMSRCYVAGSDTGLSLTETAKAIVSSSVFTGNGTAIHVEAPGSLQVVQCTFKGNTLAVDALGGTVAVAACIFDGNARGVVAPSSANTVQARGNVISVTDNPAEVFVNVTPGALNQLAIAYDPASAWEGKLATPVISNIVETDLDTLGVSRASVDFEEQGRSATGALQAGADEVGGDAGLVWLECDVYSPFVALNGMPAVGPRTGSSIVIRLGPGATSGVRSIIIAPEKGSVTGTQNIRIEPTTFPGLDRTLVANFTPVDTYVNDLLLDGVATIYVEIGATAYGVGVNEQFVSPAALADSTFVIDTVPPKLLTQNDAPVTAPYFIASHNDGDGVPFSSGTVGGADGGSSLQAKAFFNSQDALNLSIEATFQDDPPEGESVTPSGMAPLGGVSNFSLTVGEVVFPDGDPVPITAPFWDAGFEGFNTYLSAGDPASVVYSSGGGTLRATWTFAGIPADRAALNDWRIGPRFNAIDLAGNVAASDERNPVYFWWMLAAMARLTSFPYNGAVALNPIFSWDLVRLGESPGRSEPAVPQVYYRIWATTDIDNPLDGTWVEAFSGWEGPITATSFEVDPTYLAPDSVFMIAVSGVDEAGNDQRNNPAANPIDFSSGNIDGGQLAAAAAATYLPFIDFWRTPLVGQGSVETAVIPRYWHNVRGSGGYNDAIDAGEPSFGGSRVIPYPAEAGVRVEAAFLVQVNLTSGSANPGVRWELYEEGNKIDESGAFIPVPFAIVLPGSGLYELGSPDRSVNYTLRVTGSDGFDTGATTVEVFDPTPVNIQFRVVPESELEKETGGIQPFKSFTRE